MIIDAIIQMHTETILGWLALLSLFIGSVVMIGQYAISVKQHWDKMNPIMSGKKYLITLCCAACGCIPAIVKIWLLLV